MTVLVYIVLMFFMRLMGKRQLGEMEVSELICAFLISEIAASPIAGAQISLPEAIASMSVVLLFEILIPLVSCRFPAIKKWVDGVPSYLIFDGRIDQREIRRARMSVEELGAALRGLGFADLNEIRYAILEADGSISAFPYRKYAPVTPDDIKLTVPESGMAHVLVFNGYINKSSIEKLKISEGMLKNMIRSRGHVLADVFYMSINDRGDVVLIPKEKERN